MVVCYVYQDQYPWDIRVDKICTSLSNNDIETHIISRNRDGLPIFEQLSNNLYVNRLFSSSSLTIRNLFNIPAFFSPVWLLKILSVINKCSVDLLIVRDLPLAPTALIAGKIAKLPVIMDMAENYPAMTSDTWKYRGPEPLDYLIRNPWLLRKLEQFVLPKLDAILVVSEQSGERVSKMCVDGNKIFIVGNTPRLDNIIKLKQNIISRFRSLSDFIILYVGGMEESRGLQTVIQALPLIIKSKPNALLCIVGKGTSETMLKDIANKLDVSRHVFFAGWQSQDDVPSIIAASDLCIVPHYVSEHIDTTVPNKIFDYMAQKKPVIVTNAKSLMHIVENNQCGKVYPDKDHIRLADVILELEDYSLRQTYGINGYNAVYNKFNWKIDEMNLFDALYKLSGIPIKSKN
jgi:glycosyltransferase involved in cell wall biosynthesis